MTDRASLLQALRAADAAGDTAAAQAIARRLASQPSNGPSEAQTQPRQGGSSQQAVQAPVEGMLTGDEGGLEKFRSGMAGAGIKAYLGMKQMFGQLTPEEKSVLAQVNADEKTAGGWGTAGNLTGNVMGGIAASIATPEAAILGGLGRAAPYVKAALGSGLTAGVSTPIEGAETAGDIAKGKLTEAGKAAVAGPVAVAGGHILKKVLTKPFTPSVDAERLLAQGVVPTLAQGAEGRAGQFVGNLTSGVADVGNRQGKEVLGALEQRIGNGGVQTPGGTLGEVTDQLGSAWESEMGNLMQGKRFSLTKDIFSRARAAADAAKIGTRLGQQQREARAAVDNVLGEGNFGGRVNYDTLRQTYLNPLQEAADKAGTTGAQQAILEAKNVLTNKALRAGLNKEEQATLDALNERYYDLSRLREAGQGASQFSEGVDINRLAGKYANAPGSTAAQTELIEPAQRLLGQAQTQDSARTLLTAAKKGTIGLTANALTGGLAAPAYGVSLLGQTRPGARYLFGDYAAQKALREGIDNPQNRLLKALLDNQSNYGAAMTAD